MNLNFFRLAIAFSMILELSILQQAFAQNLAELKPVSAQSIAVLSPENSRVEFVGTHVGDDPKPRLGGFKNFRGIVFVDRASSKLVSMELEFEIDSIWTEFDNLTTHLLNADFFDQAKFPQATFRSTQIASIADGRCNIKGDLQLLGQTVSITLPASFQLTEQGLTLSSQFVLDRTKFGMDKMTEGVEKEVSITFTIGVPDRNVLQDKQAEPSAQPVGLQNCFVLGPQNSSVEFVGTHVGDDPKPRLGGFERFRGMVFLNEDGKSIRAISIDFEIGSIWTEFDKLTNHLMNADFFNQEQFPSASFRSGQIVNNGDGKAVLKGELTMLGKSGDVSFPISYQVNETGLILNSEFMLDRTAFGMDKMTDGVEREVSIQFSIGKPDRKAQTKLEEEKKQAAKKKASHSLVVRVFLPNMLQY